MSESTSCMMIFFFFSSRRRHTRFDCDWGSDVCSSDLSTSKTPLRQSLYTRIDVAVFCSLTERMRLQLNVENLFDKTYFVNRSEERRVGKECRYRWSTYH